METQKILIDPKATSDWTRSAELSHRPGERGQSIR